ncbi:DUF192 domain-containing protein [Candidatus Pacearchaeota archaeon]|nr:DUF192 domain-containing protein [Candidatus Pacearchaeota archaeon]
MKIHYKNKSIEIFAKKVSPIGKVLGLMFKSKETDNLLFEFKNKTKMKIHSFFVFFKFLAVWLDEKNNVVDFKIVEPFEFSVSPKKPFRKLVELPFNDKNRKTISIFVGKSSARPLPSSIKRKI